jgi:hypothetical protein
MSVLAGENPFSVCRIARARYRMSEAEWERLITRLESLSMRAALVGRRGRGKTTLLEDLAERLEARGHRVWLGRGRAGQRGLPPQLRERLRRVQPRDVFLIDSAGLLSIADFAALLWRTRRAGGLVLTAHRPGLLPTLMRLETSPEILERLVAEVSGRAVADFGRSAQELHARHRGNIRDALRELYDVCAGRAGVEGRRAAAG